jgi:AraC-like DNA-binding protein
MQEAELIQPGPNERLHSVVKIAALVDSLQAEGISPARALERVNLSQSELTSPETRVSITQILQCCRNAVALAADPFLAYRTGLRFHVSSFGMYGFAILSSTDFRHTMRFAEKYHHLATPLAKVTFKEADDCGVWTVAPLSHRDVDARLYRFLVEMQFGIHVSLQRDVMGPSFAPRALRVTYQPIVDPSLYAKFFSCPVVFGQPANEFAFDSIWLDGAPEFGNRVTYSWVRSLCDQLVQELQLRIGLVGEVRELLLANLARPRGLEALAVGLGMTPRRLRRKLAQENTSFRQLLDELKTEVAIKYLRDTELTVEDIASSMGFDDIANFRRAFRRWTNRTPNDYRGFAGPFRADGAVVRAGAAPSDQE